MDEQLAPQHGRRSVEEVLKQAPVPPMHDDGVRPFAIGTIAFLVAAVVLFVAPQAWIIEAWWLDVALTGVGIGVFGTAYCVWRRNKRARDAALGIPPPTA